MSSRDVRKALPHELHSTQHLIESCLLLYMSQAEVATTLLHLAKLEPCYTEVVWQRLVAQNPEFFRAYHVRLLVKDQILRFNELLERQVELISQMSKGGVVSSPLSNGPQTHSMNISGYQDREPTVPTIKSENVHDIISVIPNVNANGTSSQQEQECMQVAVGMPLAQNTNAGIMEGFSGGMMNSGGYSQDQEPTVPSIQSENMQHMISVIPNGYANGTSSQQEQDCRQVAAGRPLAQNTNAGIMEGFSWGMMNTGGYSQDREPTVPSIQSENMQHMISVIPNVYANGTSSQQEQECMQVVGGMPLAQNTSAGIMEGFSGGMMNTGGYTVDSPVIYGADNNLLEPCNGIREAPISPFSDGEFSPMTFNEAMLEPETNSFGHLGQMFRNFSLSDLTAGFSNSTDILESYSMFPFLGSDEDFLGSHRGGQEQDVRRSDTIMEGLSFEGFGNE